MNSIYILYYNNEPVPMTGRHKRIYTSLDSAKNAIYAIAKRTVRIGINNGWSKMKKSEKRKLVNEEVKKYSIGVFNHIENVDISAFIEL